MDSNEFTLLYWRQYIMLEKEFALTDSYVSIHKENLTTFSATYHKLLLQIGSEVDIVTKQLCKLFDPKFNKRSIDQYSLCIVANAADFTTTNVRVKLFDMTLSPWKDWNVNTPYWWTAYNAIKHNRTGTEEIDGVKRPSHQHANLRFTIEALAGLFQMCIYMYERLAQTEAARFHVPLPGSRLFELLEGRWDQVTFYEDSAMYIDPQNGNLMLSEGNFHY